MKKQFLTLVFFAASIYGQAAPQPTLYINNGNLVYQSNGVAVAGLQFTVPSTTGLTINSGLSAIKSLTCGPTICIIIGNNTTAIPDGPLVNLATLPTNILGATPVGAAQSITPSTNPCDITKDGKIDVNDFAAIVQIAAGAVSGTADINGDGKTDIFDVFRVVLAIASGGSCKVGP